MSIRCAGYPMPETYGPASSSCDTFRRERRPLPAGSGSPDSGRVVGRRTYVGAARAGGRAGASEGRFHPAFRFGGGFGTSVGLQRRLAPLPDELGAGERGGEPDQTHPRLVEPVAEE